MTSVFGGFLVNLILAHTNWLWDNGQVGLSMEETLRVLLYLLVSFIIKDILKVTAYSMVAYDPFIDWKEHDVSNHTRLNARKRTIFGTLDEQAIERRRATLEPRMSTLEQTREARCSEARIRRVSQAALHRSICDEESYGA